jgi:hypothetical protein
MTDNWTNIAIEIALFTLLGILYYFYQKKKIIHYEENKKPAIMGYLLQACLTDKTDEKQPDLDAVIEALDDYVHGKSATPPSALLKMFASGTQCSPELRDIIHASLEEIGE